MAPDDEGARPEPAGRPPDRSAERAREQPVRELMHRDEFALVEPGLDDELGDAESGLAPRPSVPHAAREAAACAARAGRKVPPQTLGLGGTLPPPAAPPAASDEDPADSSLGLSWAARSAEVTPQEPPTLDDMPSWVKR